MKRRPSSSAPPANRTNTEEPLTEAAFHRRVSQLLQQFAQQVTDPPPPTPPPALTRAPTNRSLAEATREFQRDVVKQALDEHATPDGKWNISATARALGVARSHVYTLLDELGLDQEGLRRRRRTSDPIDPEDLAADAAEQEHPPDPEAPAQLQLDVQ